MGAAGAVNKDDEGDEKRGELLTISPFATPSTGIGETRLDGRGFFFPGKKGREVALFRHKEGHQPLFLKSLLGCSANGKQRSGCFPQGPKQLLLYIPLGLEALMLTQQGGGDGGYGGAHQDRGGGHVGVRQSLRQQRGEQDSEDRDSVSTYLEGRWWLASQKLRSCFTE